jgi:GT2 family glycosyltransferase
MSRSRDPETVSDDASPLVAVVILNWRKPAETLACLRSLEQCTYPSIEVIVVDNGSGDDSVALIRQDYPNLQILKTGANLGYAGGNNVGIRHALEHGAEAVLVLNNDIVVAPDFLEPLVDAANRPAGPAIVTAAVCEMARQGVVWAMGADINWRDGSPVRLHCGEPYASWRGASPHQVGYAAGSAMLAPRRVWEVAGLIDEAYFLYYEDADWCMQARRAGFDVLGVPGSVVWHDVEAEQGRRSPAVTYYMTRNALRFLERNLPAGQQGAPLLRAVLQAHWHVLGDLKNGQGARARARLQGVRDYALRRFGPRPGQIPRHPLERG